MAERSPLADPPRSQAAASVVSHPSQNALRWAIGLRLVVISTLFLGILLISMGYKIRDVIEKEWLLYVAGGLSVLSGLYIFFNPEGAAVSIVWIIAAWAIATGLLRIWFAFKIRNVRDNIGERITRRMA